MSDPFDSNLLRILQEAETLADAGGSEELLSQIRENIEMLLVLTSYTGTSGTATQDPPNDTTGVFTDSGASWATDEHNNRSLVIIDGLAVGNIYTIDDTTTTTLICTGDNLYSDGVRSGDKYKVFYNIKGFIAHDHDAINSALVVLADGQVTEIKIASNAVSQVKMKDNAIGQAEMRDNAIGQAELRKGLTEVSTSSLTFINIVLPGGEYGFYPRILMNNTGSYTWGAMILRDDTFAGWTSPVANIAMHTDGSNTIYANQRYITASGEIYWIFILRDKMTQNIISAVAADDHVCFGNGGKPLLVPHPFSDFDPAIQEIIVINPDATQILEIQNRTIDAAEDVPDRSFIQVIGKDYNIDEAIRPPWPTIPVTVGLPPDWESKQVGEKIIPIKKIIPQPAGILTARLVLK